MDNTKKLLIKNNLKFKTIKLVKNQSNLYVNKSLDKQKISENLNKANLFKITKIINGPVIVIDPVPRVNNKINNSEIKNEILNTNGKTPEEILDDILSLEDNYINFNKLNLLQEATNIPLNNLMKFYQL